jgi:hypothetical protein
MFEGVMNVGLAVGNEGDTIEVADVLEACDKCGVIVIGKPVVVDSDSEPTAVMTFAAPVQADIYDLAKVLQQDCIAVYDSRNWRGKLIGPKAESWGTFDPAFFFTSTGKRLSDILGDVA